MADASGSPTDRLVLISLILLSSIALYLRASKVKKIIAENKWLAILIVYIAASILWSNFPGISFRRVLRCVGMLMSVLIVLTESDPQAATEALLRRAYLFFIPVSILTIKYFRTIGVAWDWSGTEEMWVGLSMHKNNLGQVVMCSGLFFLWEVLRQWPKKKLTLDLGLLILTLWLLRGSRNSHSSTAILSFLFGAFLLVAIQFLRKKPRRAKGIIVAVIIVSLLLFPIVYISSAMLGSTPLGMVVSATGRDLTFTGRVGLWQDLLQNAAKNPILGVGYGAFWVGSIGYDLYPLENWSRETPQWRPNEGHNGYVDTYVDLGMVGITLLLIVLVLALKGALDDLPYRFDFALLRLVILFAIILNNVTESSFLKGTHSLWFMFLLVAINLPRPISRTKAIKVPDLKEATV